MKKAFALVVLIVTPTMAFAQGTVVFANQTGLVKQWTTGWDSTPIAVPKGGGYVQLIAAPKGTPLLNPMFTGYPFLHANYGSLLGFLAANPGWAVPAGAANPGPIGLGAGIFANGNATISGIAPGGSVDYIILGWTGSFTTFDAALTAADGCMCGACMGESAVATTTTGDPSTIPPELPVFLKTTFAGMTLAPVVPEPNTVALAGLGAAMLMLFRRRK